MTNRMILRLVMIFGFMAGVVETGWAFNGETVTEGPVQLSIGEIGEVTSYNSPLEVVVSIRNNGSEKQRIKVRVGGLVDEWYEVGEKSREMEVAAGGEVKTNFYIVAGRGACSALYPVHIYADFSYEGKEHTAHAVQIFKTNFLKAEQANGQLDELPLNIVPRGGGLALYSLNTGRVVWQYYDKEPVYMPVGWQGSAAGSAANFSRNQVALNTVKDAIIMHPPWKGGGGDIFCEYRLKLPKNEPVKLLFSNAIKKTSDKEPASDGVTFRVWVGQEKLFERNTDSKEWLGGEVDLSRFAGKEILLRLESDPGPKRNTTCDLSYWAEPVVWAGKVPERMNENEKGKNSDRVRSILAGAKENKNELRFNLEDGCSAALVMGCNGLLDCALGFGAADKYVVFNGMKISILDHKVAEYPPQIAVKNFTVAKKNWGRETEVRHELVWAGEKFDLVAIIWKEKGGLRIKWKCPKRITDLTWGAADQKAGRVYYGHGYCIEDPRCFKATFGGHRLSTSQVGFDFEEGVSLLAGCDYPPDCLEVNPDEKIYALHTHLDATLTFVAGTRGAFDCAIRYREIDGRRASPGFERKAGRFVFDIWGGKYADNARLLKGVLDYGVTDAMLTLHSWQRWGYDYRLPDIYPPNPNLGTIEDMLEIGRICKEYDIPWGLHDNYIDFYPDAEDYSYDHIAFNQKGEPIKGWYNRGRKAQSYWWRPDHIMGFVKRNLKMIKEGLGPTHYFIDVFTSLPCFDYHDREGNFHSMLETRQCWGEAFRWLQDYLGGAVTTSEAGHDQLVGYLDGADCQHITIDSPKAWTWIDVGGKDWERAPWFDAVLHNKFSLHGVGYGSRYSVEPEEPGVGVVVSDDYISAEILEGHALMVGRKEFGRGAVRKYWLAQDFVRSIATDTMQSVEFYKGDIHRQIVSWNSGAKVYVNRGETDWQVAGKILPQYGYYAITDGIESSIERIKGVIVEQSRGPGRFYVYARGAEKKKPKETKPRPRWNEENVPIDFGAVITKGGFRYEREKDSIKVMPLPKSEAFKIELRVEKLDNIKDKKIKSIEQIDKTGKVVKEMKFEQKDGLVRFTTEGNEFGYRIGW